MNKAIKSFFSLFLIIILTFSSYIKVHAETSLNLSSPSVILMEKSTGIKIEGLSVDGGASANDLLLSFQADILGTTVLRPECIETTALGAAYLAGLATGVYKSTDEIKKNRRISKTFSPDKDDTWRNEKMAIWKKAVARSLDWK